MNKLSANVITSDKKKKITQLARHAIKIKICGTYKYKAAFSHKCLFIQSFYNEYRASKALYILLQETY